MIISQKLTQQKLLEILVAAYEMGQEVESVDLKEFVEEIKDKVLMVIYPSKNK
ncbi:hypothetical protein [Bacillus salipaludis]|uniref:Uncharacterized protein n=1 Tax=Bacillus salipaludis TaxID=2547811 RepID=A0AA90R4C4_9BACI|nr:hypothetical protein [Bacillus salipaludis]MDQ6600128.1 hypothetical protein [Bacillus salipaludis]